MGILKRAVIPAIILALLLTATGHAKPVAVTLYPSSADVTEEITVPLHREHGLLSGIFTLPAAARTDSIRIQTDSRSGMSVADLRFKHVERTPGPKLEKLKQQLKNVQASRTAILNKQRAHKAAAAFWKAQAAPLSGKASQASSMADAIRAGLEEELAAAAKLQSKAETLAKQIQELQKAISELTGGSAKVLQVSIGLTGAAGKSAALRCTYRVNNASWTPRYVLDARPENESVAFTWYADVAQHTGTNWDSVAITLATAAFTGGTTPPPMGKWNIRPQEPVFAKAARKAAPMAESMDRSVALTSAQQAPVRQRKRFFDSYDVGSATIASGGNRRITLAQTDIEAQFDYLIRPYRTPRAFTRATLSFGQAVRYPQGQAVFQLDGAYVRNAPLTLHGKQATLFFGADPEVKIAMERDRGSSGETGIFDKERTMAWNWTLEITNTKASTITAHIEDALPAAKDERIEIEETLSGASKEDGLAVWKRTLAPGQATTLQWGYKTTWPAELPVNTGRP